MLNLSRVILVVLSFMALSACSKKGDKNKLDSYASFSANLALVPTENCQSDSCIDLKKEFKYLVHVGEQIYCYWDEKQTQYQVDFKTKAVEIENLITDKTTETDYYIILQKWASIFRDGHVNPILREDVSQLEFYTPPVRLEMLNAGTDHERLIVSQVSDDIKNLKIGTVITKIQGRDWQSFIAETDKLTMGSTEAMRKRQMSNLIFRQLLIEEGPKPILIEGLNGSQEVQDVVSRQLALYDGVTPAATESTGLELIKSGILPNNIGYLRIDGFSGSKMRELLNQAMDRLSTTDALLIDVRKNGGGNQSGDVILNRLTDKPIIRYKFRAVYSDMLLAFRPEISVGFNYVTGKFTDLDSSVIKGTAPSLRYKKPVAIITSPNCFSACDTFVSALSENKIATVIGERSGGGTGSPQVFELPVSGHKFRYSVVQGFTAVTDQYIEGNGTLPDVVIEPTLQERIEKKDRQLEKALNWLSENMKTVPGELPVLIDTQGQTAQPTPELPNLKINLPAQLLNVNSSVDLSQALEVELDREIRKSTE